MNVCVCEQFVLSDAVASLTGKLANLLSLKQMPH